MTEKEVKALRPGHYVQEILGAAHGGRFAKWGRPRRVLGILHRWKTTANRARAGKACVSFTVEFGPKGSLRWTAVEGKPSPALVTPTPSKSDLASWSDNAEKNPKVFDMVDPHPLEGEST